MACGWCDTGAEETQDHILNECPKIHGDNTNKVRKEEIFAEDLETLREAAIKLVKIHNKMEEHDPKKKTTKENKNKTKQKKRKKE